MKVIKVVLYVAGVLLILQGLAIFLPVGAINFILSMFGDETFPDTSLAKYGLRIILLAFFWIGIVALIAVAYPGRYRSILVILGWGFLTGGVTCLISGIVYGVAPLYYLGDFIFSVIAGILFLVYKTQAQESNQ